ncbi:DUF2496 domain-containing protein [Pseudoalteromonas sp. MMG013]|uniref:DUF2496 domain-containing protein n=1 Tax=unclassified Pseudoalteromonas TaxID=194690 RepID=UPI001B378CE5|nr:MULTISPECIES: DUF2496 domain-containing protein [unclassified Pseudoalteromonas]MBQ4844507.1 DUF2496 domain-containing protein [Pseudoalteromonas sp. MMG005]MBQ4860978.1 DUF2496 domain-containing protein [Pseudoalteromonas sp. MMG013]
MSSPLESAPSHIKLAIDLIMLLEQHDLPETEVLAALELVKADYQNKLKNTSTK